MWMAFAVTAVCGGFQGVWVPLSVSCEVPEKGGPKCWNETRRHLLTQHNHCTAVVHAWVCNDSPFGSASNAPCACCRSWDLPDLSKMWVLLQVLQKLLQCDCCRSSTMTANCPRGLAWVWRLCMGLQGMLVILCMML